jgi:hypothetical protein
MARKIIYIKNPKSGSNFRTIGGAGPSAPKQSKTPKTPKTPKTKLVDNNGFINGLTDAFGNSLYGNNASPGWQINNPKPQFDNNTSYSGLNFGTAPDYGVGPTLTDFTDPFKPPETLRGVIYDSLRGVGPKGNIQWLPFTAGSFKLIHTGNYPSWKGDLRTTTLAPNRNDPRPWWAR